MNQQFMARQGDILLVKVNNEQGFFESTKEIEPQNGKLILALGEATGHSHYVPSSDGAMFEFDQEVYLRVNTPTELRHQEHDTIQLPIGIYKKIQQREYTPERIVNVRD